ncbi:MAG: 4Fe-4S dicluster domain-containing protein [Candidatus Hydrogenedentes bacterium]|nr:4Fe-4S dicluster domain-containing protein [Candidatus Hydrogenedentota bacterium]
MMDGISRREFLEASALSAVAMGLGENKKHHIYSYNRWPENPEPGDWSFYATACRECPAGCGLYTWNRDSRCTKAEGIAGHAVNNGALCPRGQSSVQGQYDPDRLRQVARRDGGNVEQRQWPEAFAELGAGLRGNISRVLIVSRLETGALAELFKAFAGAFGTESRVLYYEPFDYAPLKEAHRIVFGKQDIPDYRIDLCQSLASFSVDFLENWISPVQFAQRFGKSRDPDSKTRLEFLYAGPRQSMTAANADEIILLPPGEEIPLAMAALSAIAASENKPGVQALTDAYFKALPGVRDRLPQQTVDRLARLFTGRKGLALGGPTGAEGPGAVMSALAAALINAATGAAGALLDFSRPHALTFTASAQEVVSALESADAKTMVIFFETNPAYDLPQSQDLIQRAGVSLYIGTLPTETSLLCNWVLPADSALESWGDYEPWKGIHDLMQPVTARLWDTRNAGEILLGLAAAAGAPLSRAGAQQPTLNFNDWLRARWTDIHRRIGSISDFESCWRQALMSGGAIEPAQPAPVKASFAPDEFARLLSQGSLPAPHLESGRAHLWLWPSIMLFDGRTANRGWMQESPEPISYAAWGSWVDIHPDDATSLEIEEGDVVALATQSSRITAPARVTAEVCPGVVALAFGQGHTAMGSNAAGVGANAFLLRPLNPEVFFGTVAVTKTGSRDYIVYGSRNQSQYGRDILQWTDHEKKKDEKIKEEVVMPLPEGYESSRDLYPPRQYAYHRWAMAIDLEKCIGCGACAVACYAENNLWVAGKVQMHKGREMAWLKVVPYRHPREDGRVGFLPLACQHCDCAPCEPVCPVYAAVHNEEGLNAQVYNRCIGTRYCSNNCPYKVRRFNWGRRKWVAPLNLQLNPEVTVRCRGVMEKCTFCIQRIRQAEFRAAREGRHVRDGEIMPACAQTCPTKAIVFGDLLDERARVTDLFRHSARRYQVLKDLNTKPAVAYLRRITGRTPSGESYET